MKWIAVTIGVALLGVRRGESRYGVRRGRRSERNRGPTPFSDSGLTDDCRLGLTGELAGTEVIDFTSVAALCPGAVGKPILGTAGLPESELDALNPGRDCNAQQLHVHAHLRGLRLALHHDQSLTP